MLLNLYATMLLSAPTYYHAWSTKLPQLKRLGKGRSATYGRDRSYRASGSHMPCYESYKAQRRSLVGIPLAYIIMVEALPPFGGNASSI